MSQVILTDSGSLAVNTWHQWADRTPMASGGIVNNQAENATLLVLIQPQGAPAPSGTPSTTTPGVLVLQPYSFLIGTCLDYQSDVYIATGGAGMVYSMSDVLGFCNPGLEWQGL